MHFEVLIEDSSGKNALDVLLPKILGVGHTFRVHPYRGVGRLPPGLRDDIDPKKRMLLTQLPRLLKGYGTTFSGYGAEYAAAVICVCDLDGRCRHEFRSDLLALLSTIQPRPQTHFCIAEEEIEAWFLGDSTAVKIAFPGAKQQALEAYEQDAICGTWEVLADSVHPGGSKALRNKAYKEVGAAKCDWARRIAIAMDIDVNVSPSFIYFREKLRALLRTGPGFGELL